MLQLVRSKTVYGRAFYHVIENNAAGRKCAHTMTRGGVNRIDDLGSRSADRESWCEMD